MDDYFPPPSALRTLLYVGGAVGVAATLAFAASRAVRLVKKALLRRKISKLFPPSRNSVLVRRLRSGRSRLKFI